VGRDGSGLIDGWIVQLDRIDTIVAEEKEETNTATGNLLFYTTLYA
jgi:hypothetical protein